MTSLIFDERFLASQNNISGKEKTQLSCNQCRHAVVSVMVSVILEYIYDKVGKKDRKVCMCTSIVHIMGEISTQCQNHITFTISRKPHSINISLVQCELYTGELSGERK